MNHHVRIFSIFFLFAFISACSSTPKHSDASRFSDQDLNSVEALLAQAEGAAPEQQAQLIIAAANLLIEDNQHDEARKVASSLTPHTLTNDNMARYALLQANLALGKNNVLAFTWLDHPMVLGNENPQIRTQAHGLRAKALHSTGNSPAAIDELILALDTATPDEQQTLEKQLWNTLLEMDLIQLQEVRQYHQIPYLTGWIELAEIIKKPSSLTKQLESIELWATTWPNHSGNTKLAELEQIVRDTATNQPKHVALFLPQSGRLEKAGDAVRDGFMAAYYNAGLQGDELPQITLYNTDQQTIPQLMNQAINDGADMVIGPLGKKQVNDMASQNLLALPALTLNYSSIPSEQLEGLFQFGLAAEDEARQAAQRGQQEGFNRAVILSPKTAWGKRVAQAFSDEWISLGGEIISQRQFTGENDYRQVIGSLLAVDQSRGRARRLSRVIGTNIEFDPRRRQDVDMVFLAATPQQGRMARPTLSFQYASSLPILSTSSIYSGQISPGKDKDLDDVKFTGFHWLLDNDNAQIRDIQQLWPRARGNYAGLYALGADAFLLHSRVRQMTRIEGIQLEGTTGVLSMNDSQRINRTLGWYQFKKGTPVKLEELSLAPRIKKENTHALDAETTLQQGGRSGTPSPELSPAAGAETVN